MEGGGCDCDMKGKYDIDYLLPSIITKDGQFGLNGSVCGKLSRKPTVQSRGSVKFKKFAVFSSIVN